MYFYRRTNRGAGKQFPAQSAKNFGKIRFFGHRMNYLDRRKLLNLERFRSVSKKQLRIKTVFRALVVCGLHEVFEISNGMNKKIGLGLGLGLTSFQKNYLYIF